MVNTALALAKPWVCYIEDKKEWRENVESYIKKKHGAEYFEFETASSFDTNFENRVNGIESPSILVIDIRIESNRLAGYTWLVDKVEEHLSKNPDTVVAVLSGELTDELTAKLRKIGVPEKHIFLKSDWADRRSVFFEFLKDTAITLKNRWSTKKFDPYLTNQVWNCREQARICSDEDPAKPAIFSILFKSKNSTWDPGEVPELRILGKIGRIYSAEGTIRSLEYLEADLEIESVEASRSAALPEYEKSMQMIGAPVVHTERGEYGDSVIIGVIDVGINVLNQAFLDESGKKSRILAVWDQRDVVGPAPTINGIEQFGTEHDRHALAGYLKTGIVPESLCDSDENEHGTQVASIAAGRRFQDPHVGVAPHAKILVVRLPNDAVGSEYSNMMIAALFYLTEKAKEEGLPLVINISQGLNAGAHDGTSLLEEAIDHLTSNGNEQGMVVVKSAGNLRDKATHAFFTIKDDESVKLRWQFDLTNGSPHFRKNFVELWFDTEDRLSFSLRGPKGATRSSEVGHLNPTASGEFSGGYGYVMTYELNPGQNSSSNLLIEATIPENAGNSVFVWTLNIRGLSIRSGNIHAWIERTECERAKFLDHVNEDFTLTIPGTSKHIISVGAADPLDLGQCPTYSSRGPTRDDREKPDLSAPGEGVFGLSCGGKYRVVSGTSMAAPHVSGAIALLLSFWTKKKGEVAGWKQLTSAQIKDALIKSTEKESWDHGFGYGVPDLDRLFESLIEERLKS